PHFQPRQVHEVPRASGGHGGGDAALAEHIFPPDPPEDPFHRSAGQEQGAASIMVGIAANRAIATGQPQKISELAHLPADAIRLSQLV
ncbi:MAG TPA: hypothetical protein VJ960_01020, partial [Oceanipulchritudo sp.]|nr:hypothetical protein [Oceanipulchritudo sp.]